jgi:hypothetical protein
MINWFKENFKSKEYLKAVRRQKSPRIKTAIDPLTMNKRGSSSIAEWGDLN